MHTAVELVDVDTRQHLLHIQGTVDFVWFLFKRSSSSPPVSPTASNKQDGFAASQKPAPLSYLTKFKKVVVAGIVTDAAVEAIQIDLTEETTLSFPLDRGQVFEGFQGKVDVARVMYYPGCGAIHVSYTFQGYLRQPLQLTRFPFDRHALLLKLEINPDFSDLAGMPLKFVAMPSSRLQNAEILDGFILKRAFTCRLGAGMIHAWRKGPSAESVRGVDFSGTSPRYTFLFERHRTKIMVSVVTPSLVQSSFALLAFAMPCNQRFEQFIVALLPLFVLSRANGLGDLNVATPLDYYLLGLQLFPAVVSILVLCISLGLDPLDLADASTSVYCGSTPGILVAVLWFLVNCICLVLTLSGRFTINWHEVMVVATQAGLQVADKHRTAKVQVSKPKPTEKPLSGIGKIAGNPRNDQETEKEKGLSELEKSVILDRIEKT